MRLRSLLAALAAALLLGLVSAEVSVGQGQCLPGLPVMGCGSPRAAQSPPAGQSLPSVALPCGGSSVTPQIAQRDFVGIVSEDAFAGSASYRKKTFMRQCQMGIGTIRQAFTWSDIERRRGRYRFSTTDRFVADAARHGITVLPILFGTPSFRSTKPRRGALRGAYPPRRPSDITGFASALARRYGPSGSFWRQKPSLPKLPIRSWQIWNEPNLPVYWRPKPSAEGYVRLLTAASRAIKRVDGGAEIVTAGMPQSPNGVRLQSYIAAMYRARGKRAFDTLAINPYGATSGEVLKRVEKTRATMDRFGDSTASIWVTELGWADTGPESRFTLGPEEQAAQIGATIVGLWEDRARLRVRGFIYFNWRDARPYAGGKDFWGLHTGLLNIRGRDKPAYGAFREAVRGLL